MPDVQVKRGEAARQQPAVAVSERDREAAAMLQRYTLGGDAYGVSGEFEARMEWCADGEYVDFAEALKAIAQARAEEREACASACLLKVSRPAGHRGQWEGYGGFDDDMTGPECAAAIRARGEK